MTVFQGDINIGYAGVPGVTRCTYSACMYDAVSGGNLKVKQTLVFGEEGSV